MLSYIILYYIILYTLPQQERLFMFFFPQTKPFGSHCWGWNAEHLKSLPRSFDMLPHWSEAMMGDVAASSVQSITIRIAIKICIYIICVYIYIYDIWITHDCICVSIYMYIMYVLFVLDVVFIWWISSIDWYYLQVPVLLCFRQSCLSWEKPICKTRPDD